MPSTDQSQILQDRMLDFAVMVIQTSSTAKIPLSVKDQVTRSATSIGANYSEARNAISKTDFRSKIYIAKKEASETAYWLKLIARLDPNCDTTTLDDECRQLLMILQKTVNTINAK